MAFRWAPKRHRKPKRSPHSSPPEARRSVDSWVAQSLGASKRKEGESRQHTKIRGTLPDIRHQRTTGRNLATLRTGLIGSSQFCLQQHGRQVLHNLQQAVKSVIGFQVSAAAVVVIQCSIHGWPPPGACPALDHSAASLNPVSACAKSA
jgi:hypothetical protein